MQEARTRTNVHYLVFHLTLADTITSYITLPMETLWRLTIQVMMMMMMMIVMMMMMMNDDDDDDNDDHPVVCREHHVQAADDGQDRGLHPLLPPPGRPQHR